MNVSRRSRMLVGDVPARTQPGTNVATSKGPPDGRSAGHGTQVRPVLPLLLARPDSR